MRDIKLNCNTLFHEIPFCFCEKSDFHFYLLFFCLLEHYGLFISSYHIFFNRVKITVKIIISNLFTGHTHYVYPFVYPKM